MTTDLITTNHDAEARPIAAPGGWNRERIDLVKRTVCPTGVTDDEFALFLETCRRSGLDPLQKQIFCVPRRTNIGSKDSPKWVTKHEPQPSEAGMLARAEAFPDFLGITAAPVHADEECELDVDGGVVKHRVRPTAKRGELMGAWAKVHRNGRPPVVVYLPLAERRQKSGMWDQMPATMIVKCARVAALRTAYPAAFGGLYTADELPPDPSPRGTRAAPPERSALPAAEAPAHEVALWQAEFAGAESLEALQSVGDRLAKAYAHTHPVLAAVRPAYAQRLQELKAA